MSSIQRTFTSRSVGLVRTTDREGGTVEIEGAAVDLPPDKVVVQFYGPLRFEIGDRLEHLQVSYGGLVEYTGPALVHNISKAAAFTNVTFYLLEAWPTRTQVLPDDDINGAVRRFVAQWDEAAEKIDPAYRAVVSRLRYTLIEVYNFLQHLEKTLRSRRMGSHLASLTTAREAASSLLPELAKIFGLFEDAARRVPSELVDIHAAHARRALHPWIRMAPFADRVFAKPLGIPGDYGMVQQILGEPFQGENAFAQVINAFALGGPVAQGHRNRIDILVRLLTREAEDLDGSVDILDVGCGPAEAERRFLVETSWWTERVSLRMLDTSREALGCVEAWLAELARKGMAVRNAEFLPLSVKDLLRSARSSVFDPKPNLVICAGLFDYLGDSLAKAVTKALYEILGPGGLLVITNVSPDNPTREMMRHLLAWELILRDEAGLSALAKGLGTQEMERDETGTNLILQIRK